jgi:hypothetical protein
VLARDIPAGDRAGLVATLERLFGRPVDLGEVERIAPERLQLALCTGRRLHP